MFKKYKLKVYKNGIIITERFLLFFTKVLCINKQVQYKNGNFSTISREMVSFRTIPEARLEANILNMGEKPIKYRLYNDGKLIKEVRR